MYPVITNGVRTGDPRGFNKGCSLKFCVGSWVRQTPEEGRRTYRLKRCRNNNKDEDMSPKTLNDKNHQASSQKVRQLVLKCSQMTFPRYLIIANLFYQQILWIFTKYSLHFYLFFFIFLIFLLFFREEVIWTWSI